MKLNGIKKLSQLTLLCSACSVVALASNVALAEAYKAAAQATGEVSVVGSDTVSKAAKLWVEDFKVKQAGLKTNLTEADSGEGASALVSGKADIGMMSRTMKPQEILAFQSKKGYQPTQIIVGVDAIAVIVHPSNSLKSASIPQIDGIFSSTLKCGGKAVDTWGALGVTGDLASKAPTLYSREAKSGTRGMFEKEALCKGTFKTTIKEIDHNAGVTSGVGADASSAGYTSLAGLNSSVKAIAVSKKDGDAAIELSEKTVIDQTYPLSRGLYLYVDKAPTKALDPKIAEFVRYAISAEGQALVKKAGYVSITDTMAAEGKKGAGL